MEKTNIVGKYVAVYPSMMIPALLSELEVLYVISQTEKQLKCRKYKDKKTLITFVTFV